MTSQSKDSIDLLEVMRSGPVGVTSPDEQERIRAEMLPWLEAQVMGLPRVRAAKKQARRGLWVGGTLIAAAAGVVLVLSLGRGEAPSEATLADARMPSEGTTSTEGFATVTSGKVTSSTLEVLVGSRIGLGSRVATPADEGATLTATTGVQIALEPSTDLSLAVEENTVGRGVHEQDAQGSQLVLHQGQATFSVPPLPVGESFIVTTKDARVTVVGTKFSVARGDDQTCVRVTEGKVRVARSKQEVLLTAGQSSGCGSPSAQDQTPSKAVEDKTSGKQSAPTTLAQENALLTRALAAERRGDHEHARRSFEELLVRYPKSAFAKDARDGLTRLE